MNALAYGFLAGLGQKISAISGDDRETCYLFQRICVLIQRFNATLLHDSFADENRQHVCYHGLRGDDDQQSQWEMLKFDPQLTLNPLSDRHKIWRA